MPSSSSSVRRRNKKGGKRIFRKSKRHAKHTSRRRKTHTRYRLTGGYGPGAGPIGWPVNASNPTSWPGVSGSASAGGNYLPLSPNATTPGGNVGGVPSNPQVLQKGGFGLSDFTNVIREATAGLSHLGSTFRGSIPPLSSYPSPVYQGIDKMDTTGTPYISRTPDIKAYHTASSTRVANL